MKAARWVAGGAILGLFGFLLLAAVILNNNGNGTGCGSGTTGATGTTGSVTVAGGWTITGATLDPTYTGGAFQAYYNGGLSYAELEATPGFPNYSGGGIAGVLGLPTGGEGLPGGFPLLIRPVGSNSAGIRILKSDVGDGAGNAPHSTIDLHPAIAALLNFDGKEDVEIKAAGNDPGVAPGTALAAGGACDALEDPALSAQVAAIAAKYVGDGPNIPGFTPPSTTLEWCAWFASNVWKLAGVPIAVTYASEDLYNWGASHHTLWMAVGQAPPGPTPPLGAALEYGSGPQSTATSLHVNLVSKINPDGSFMLIGGNEANGEVGLSGPCRLTGGAGTAHLTGPGCDTREVYGIAAPGTLVST